MRDSEHSLLNFANYRSIRSIRKLLKRINELQRISEFSQTALCIWIDLKEAIKKAPTEKQRYCLVLYYICKETQKDIANEIGISQQSINAYIKGGERNIQKFLLDGSLYQGDHNGKKEII